MVDRPTAAELLDAVRQHLEGHIVPAIKNDRKLYFQTLVSINVLKIIERELNQREDHLHEAWQALNTLTETAPPPPPTLAALEATLEARHHDLCNAIQAGDYDTPNAEAQLMVYLIQLTEAQLAVANPLF